MSAWIAYVHFRLYLGGRGAGVAFPEAQNRTFDARTCEITQTCVFIVGLTNGRAIAPTQSYAPPTRNYLNDGHFSVMFMGLLILYVLHYVFTLLNSHLKYIRHKKERMETVAD